MERILKALDTLLDVDAPVMIAGDFNTPEVDWLDLWLSSEVSIENQLGNFCVLKWADTVSGEADPMHKSDKEQLRAFAFNIR